MTSHKDYHLVFRGHLARYSESVEMIIKSVARTCEKERAIRNDVDLFPALLEYNELFWREMPPETAEVCEDWLAWVGKHFDDESVKDADIKAYIFKRFVTRLSLNARLLCKPHDTDGNKIVDLFVDVAQNAIYASVDFRDLRQTSNTKPYSPMFSSLGPIAPPKPSETHSLYTNSWLGTPSLSGPLPSLSGASSLSSLPPLPSVSMPSASPSVTPLSTPLVETKWNTFGDSKLSLPDKPAPSSLRVSLPKYERSEPRERPRRRERRRDSYSSDEA